jgi:hypothetical protein
MARGKDYILQALLPVQINANRIGVGSNYADRAFGYRHSTRWQGGYWEASWTFKSPPSSDLYLREWFENRLGHRHEETVGGAVTWEGIVWTMDLALDGIVERYDMGEIFNAVKSVYRDSGGSQQETAFFIDQDSIDRYGRRELIVVLDHVAAAEATAQAETTLALKSQPVSTPVAIDPEIDDGLKVTAVGEVFTMNNRYVTAGDGTTGNISDFVTTIINTDCDNIDPGVIETNTLQILKETDLPIRAWDLLLRLAESGDASDNPWRLTVGGGYAAYQAADNTPLYEWTGRNPGLTTRIGGQSYWQLQPGILRNLTRRQRTLPTGTFFDDGRDSLIGEVVMGDFMPFPQLKPEEAIEDEIAANQKYFRRILEQEAIESGR